MPATILVVEDDPTLREVVREILYDAGYDVVPAVDGRDAVDLLKRIRPDLILSDINMSGMDGYEFYTTLRANPDHELIPFIFVTARDERDEILHGKSLGVEDYLTKPFDKAELLLVVEARLRRAESMRRATRHQLDALKYRLVEMLNHELRTPIGVVKGYVDLAIGSGDQLDPDTLADYLQTISHGADRLSALVEDLVQLIELETGITERRFRESCQRIEDISPLVDSAVATCAERADKADIRLRVSVPGNLPAITGNERMLANVLTRLLDNAIKFSPRGGGVRIGAGMARGNIFVAVRDSGPGIPNEEIDAVFDVFHQSRRSFFEQQGAGLGLPIARGLVELHGGVIEVDSQDGRGATFVVVLPAAD